MFSIDHIAFSVQDIEKSKAFYVLLGFSLIKEWKSDDLSIHMALIENHENILVELVQHEGCKPLPEYAKNYKANLQYVGIKHLALRVKSVEDALTFLTDKGITNVSAIQIGKLGRAYFFINDPDGNVLEFMQDNNKK
jgi:glyoxylase I family protein